MHGSTMDPMSSEPLSVMGTRLTGTGPPEGVHWSGLLDSSQDPGMPESVNQSGVEDDEDLFWGAGNIGGDLLAPGPGESTPIHRNEHQHQHQHQQQHNQHQLQHHQHQLQEQQCSQQEEAQAQEREVVRLTAALQEAVRAEEYMLAGHIKAQINALQSGMEGAPPHTAPQPQSVRYQQQYQQQQQQPSGALCPAQFQFLQQFQHRPQPMEADPPEYQQQQQQQVATHRRESLPGQQALGHDPPQQQPSHPHPAAAPSPSAWHAPRLRKQLPQQQQQRSQARQQQIESEAAAAEEGHEVRYIGTKYKTSLCSSFQARGMCKYNDKCLFAHGTHELRETGHPQRARDNTPPREEARQVVMGVYPSSMGAPGAAGGGSTHSLPSQAVGALSPACPQPEWSCDVCTFDNKATSTECEMCGAKPPARMHHSTQQRQVAPLSADDPQHHRLQHPSASQGDEWAVAGKGHARHDSRQQQQQQRMHSFFVFVCNSQTEIECLENQLFGMPRNMLSEMEKIDEDTILVLHNFETRVMHGMFRAGGPPGLNLDPRAWGTKWKGGSQFPAQVWVCRREEEKVELHLPREVSGSLKMGFVRDLDARRYLEHALQRLAE